jgi:uncharacterized membrane protein YoaK (UPF0700 family)
VPRSESLSPAEFRFIALLALAMGLQNATLTRFSSLTLHTGFVTGTLVKMSEQFTKYLTWSFEEMKWRHKSMLSVLRRSAKQNDFRGAMLLGAIWMAYVVGAICGAAGHLSMDLRSLFIAMVGLGFMAFIDLRQPLAISDERAQGKVP